MYIQTTYAYDITCLLLHYAYKIESLMQQNRVLFVINTKVTGTTNVT